jgi:hypothetical protein
MHQLRVRFGGYEVGSWFYIPDELTEFSRNKTGPRPIVLIFDYRGGPSALSFARSSSVASDFPHRAHPPKHERKCKIDLNGWIALFRISLDADWLQDTYMCFEPHEETLLALRNIRGAP